MLNFFKKKKRSFSYWKVFAKEKPDHKEKVLCSSKSGRVWIGIYMEFDGGRGCVLTEDKESNLYAMPNYKFPDFWRHIPPLPHRLNPEEKY